MNYDALLFLSYGGPEGPDDVIPFMENVLRGKNVPRARMEAVSEHYKLFDGVSPINAQNRALIAALKTEFAAHNIELPIYFGNRNWHPMLHDTVQQMIADGVQRALVFATAAYSSYSSCRQYLEDLAGAKTALPNAPEMHKLRQFYNHPGFIETMIERTRDALAKIPAERRATADLIFTAHSIPLVMADSSDYVAQLNEVARLLAEGVGRQKWKLVYQSRSGPPHQPWLEPDICDHLTERHAAGVQDAVVVPIGFISDHMEVVFDLDTEAAQVSADLGLNMVRAGTAGTHPRFVTMIRELVTERLSVDTPRLALGHYPARPDVCPADCCVVPQPKISTRPANVGGRPAHQ